MDLNTLRTCYRDKILHIAEECKAENIRVFGSIARGDAQNDSDIDFLVHLQPDASLSNICELRLRLEDLLGCKVDVASDRAKMHLLVQNNISKDAVQL